jgi:thiamine transport system substrate-binding protein
MLFTWAGLPVGAAIAQEKPVLTVATYAAFAGKYGPGKVVKERFETICVCTLSWLVSDDAAGILSRLKLEGAGTKADVLLGLDANLVAEATATGLLTPHGLSLTGLELPVVWADPASVPFDWGYLAFVYDANKLEKVPRSLKELVEDPSGPKLIVEDPRTSAPGLGLLLWMRSVYGDEAETAWAKLRPRIVTFTKGWSEAYGLFLKGEADMVLSYTTSPAYHTAIEKKTNYRAATFAEGHYLHVELAAMVKSSRQLDLARRFLDFVLSESFQSAIPEGNWMYSVKALAGGLPASFSGLAQPSRGLMFSPEQVRNHRRAWIDNWLAAVSQ